jgi:hypothetical protein
MTIEDFLKQEITLRWERRDARPVPKIARHKIQLYFEEWPGGVIPSVITHYQRSRLPETARMMLGKRSLELEEVFPGRDQQEWLLKKIDGEIKRTVQVDRYLSDQKMVYLRFMAESYQHSHIVIEENLGSSRLGRFVKL